MKTTYIYIFVLSFLFSTEQLYAQPKQGSESPWYIGAKSSVIFGGGSSTSFGAGKTRPGYNAGALVGYQINPIFSTEISVVTGHVELAARGCCAANYWLGANGTRYFAPLTQQVSYSYSDIYSSVTLQQLGLQFNINLIHLINRTSDSRWSILVSPAIYSIGSKAIIKTSFGSKTIFTRDYRMVFGAGTDVALEYAITKSLGVRLGAGINVPTGNNFDGMPKGVHGKNFLWNSNLAFTWRFGRGKSKIKSLVVRELSQQQKPKVESQSVEYNKVDTVKIETETKPQENGATSSVKVLSETKQITLPSIYFAFDSYKIDQQQLPAMNRILSAMQEYPQMEITVIGWSDPLGSNTVNNSISLKRAKAVGKWLTDRGISASRIKYYGMGVDKTQSDYKKARRAEVKSNKED